MSSEEWIKSFYSEFGRRLRNARAKAGLTQAELATQLDLTRSSIANLESGRQRIQIHLIPVISRILSTSAESLLPGGEGLPRSEEKSLAGVSLNSISETAQKFVLDALEISSLGKSNDAS